MTAGNYQTDASERLIQLIDAFKMEANFFRRRCFPAGKKHQTEKHPILKNAESFFEESGEFHKPLGNWMFILKLPEKLGS
jgi:hypothetical protein